MIYWAVQSLWTRLGILSRMFSKNEVALELVLVCIS